MKTIKAENRIDSLRDQIFELDAAELELLLREIQSRTIFTLKQAELYAAEDSELDMAREARKAKFLINGACNEWARILKDYGV